MDKQTLVETLANIEFLHGASREHLEQIADVAQARDYAKSDVVFREGADADSVYLVASGKLSLELSPATVYHKHLVNVGAGEMLGWSSLVENHAFAATAVVAEPARLIRINAARLRAICNEDPQFGYEFMSRTIRALAKRLTTTWGQLAHAYVSQYVPVSTPDDA